MKENEREMRDVLSSEWGETLGISRYACGKKIFACGIPWNKRKKRGVKGVMMMPIILGGREGCSVM